MGVVLIVKILTLMFNLSANAYSLQDKNALS